MVEVVVDMAEELVFSRASGNACLSRSALILSSTFFTYLGGARYLYVVDGAQAFSSLVSTADAHELCRRLQHPLERDLVFGLCWTRDRIMTNHRRIAPSHGSSEATKNLGFEVNDLVH